MKRILLFCVLLFTPMLVFSLTLSPNVPKLYVVKPGDSLWSIASKFLQKPWQWKELWHANPYIKNPNLIYPGAIIELRYYQGKPYLAMTRKGTLKLSPHARPRPAEKAIPPIPLQTIKPFLNGSQVFDYDDLLNAPYIVDYLGEHMLAGQDVEIYVKDLPPSKQLSYSIFRPNGSYQDPDTGAILGYIGTFIGNAQMLNWAPISTLVLTEIKSGAKIRDRVLPNIFINYSLFFEPQAPLVPIKGHIIDLFGGLTQVGSNQVIVIDRGKNLALRPGDVVAIFQPGRVVPDPLNKQQSLKLPNERVAEAMIFKTFSQTSYALVVSASRAVNKFDIVTNP